MGYEPRATTSPNLRACFQSRPCNCTKLLVHGSQASTGATQAQQVSVKGQPYWKRRESTYSRVSMISFLQQEASLQKAEPLKQVTFKKSVSQTPDPEPSSVLADLQAFYRSSLAFHRPGVLQVWEKNLCNMTTVMPSIPAPYTAWNPGRDEWMQQAE